MRFLHSTKRSDTLPSRRLSFESLERRDLLTVFRIVDWNTLNRPNNLPVNSPNPPTDGNYFQTILAAIGNETIQGNTKPIDILAVQEIDQSGDQSLSKLESILDGLYPSTNYDAVISTEVGGDATGFIYDTSTVSRVGDPVFITAGLTHPITRVQFRPADTFGESDFYVYSIHLKSGTTGSDATTRGDEALVLRNDADSLGAGANVLFVGDFNMQNSSETAYTRFVAAGAGQLQDVANAPGNWHGTAAFISLHSQDPRIGGTGMDDRFDIQFASGEFFDDVSIDYIDGSYHVFGNTGTHTLGQNITTNSSAPPGSVLDALARASDHLPVVVDYELIVSTPRVRLIETGGNTKVAEGSFYDVYGVVLDTIPTANVTVNVMPNSQVDLGNGPGVMESLLFTPANALTPQFLVVNAADDALVEGTHAGLITHSSASADAAYNGLTIASVNVTILDNEAPVFVINEIDPDQVGADTAEFIELYDGGIGHVSLSGKTIVLFSGSNDRSYAAFSLNGFFTDANGLFVLNKATVPTFTDGLLQNGQDAAALYAAPVTAFPNNTPVTTSNLLDAVVYGPGPNDTGLAPLLLALQPQPADSTTLSLSRVPDGGDQRKTDTYVSQMPTPGILNQPPTPGVFLYHSGTRVDVAESGVSDSYQLALKTLPTYDVTIAIDPDSQIDLGAGAGVAIVLVFTPTDALIPQTVTVTAVDDILVEASTHYSQITHSVSSGDSRYDGFPIGTVVANVVDNDVFDPTSVVISEIMYNPASDESAPGIGEWVEIVNTGNVAMDLAGWFLHDEDTPNWGTVPTGTYLYPNQVGVYFDAAFATKANFRDQWSVPSNALLLPVSWQGLGNTASSTQEVLELWYGQNLQADIANYFTVSPWPSGANGPSIYLKGLLLDNNTGANWARSVAGANDAIHPTGPDYVPGDTGSPGRAYIPGDYNTDGGNVDAADYVVWRHFVGSTTVRPPDGSGPTTGLPNGIVDEFDYSFWMQNFGRQPAPVVSSGGAGESVSEIEVGELIAAMSQSVSSASHDPGAEIMLAINLASLQSTPTLIVSKKLAVQSTSLPSASTVTELLLLLNDTPSLSTVNVETFGPPHESSEGDSAEFDKFFDQLGDGADLLLFN